MKAPHYGFTDLPAPRLGHAGGERDFVINYDIKYRIGTDSDDGDEE